MGRPIQTLLWIGLVILPQAGCQKKLNDERTVVVEPGEEKLIIADPASRDQAVNVSWNSSGTPVSVYLYLEKDQKEAAKAITLGNASRSLLGKKEQSESGELEVQVPAGEKITVMLTSRKQAKVGVKILGK
jgi:hypothetical protein